MNMSATVYIQSTHKQAEVYWVQFQTSTFGIPLKKNFPRYNWDF